ncbi:MAG: hypothetical protein ABSD28_12455 [Tepidisphaeraceae bacterium]|jgi:hypothetical protein
MGMREGRGVLRKAMNEMMMHWAETKAQWNDGNAHNFESRFLATWEGDAKRAVSAMDTMSAILSKIAQDCEPD